MTTIVYHRPLKTIVADTQYTSNSGQVTRVHKIERLKDGRFFLGSGHSYPLAMTKMWAETGFSEEDEPDWAVVLENAEDMAFAALVVSKDGKRVWMVDDELAVVELLDDVIGIGSGGDYATAAIDAGADPVRAVEIACGRDIYSSLPLSVHRIGVDE
jgi:ATP-dependent protease HslVU (ClpYQ) peptidase subunit